jgi:hypothetical protein
MSGDYPDTDELGRIESWPADDPLGWFAYIKSVGNYWPDPSWGWTEENGFDLERPVRVIHVSTGGWSGNEDILEAMHANLMLWATTWTEHRRGGHYTFEVPTPP